MASGRGEAGERALRAELSARVFRRWIESATTGEGNKTRTALRPGGNKLEVQVPDDRSEPIVFSVRIAPASPTAAPVPGDSPLKNGETRYVVEYDVPAKDVYAANIQGDVGTDELGAAVCVFDRDGELVSRNALNLRWAWMNKRQKSAKRQAEFRPDREPATGEELFVSGLVGHDDRPDRNRECGRGRQEAHKVARSVRS